LEGNNTGYGLGFKDGNLTGYAIGYKVGFADGNTTGFQIGYKVGYLQGVIDGAGRGVTLRDPTYDEAISFIEFDKTDQNEYVPGNYTCVDFAANFKHNAMTAGYKCAFVYIEFRKFAHAVVAFNTTDRGIIYVEPQTDELINVEVGQALYGEIIIRVIIIW